jgi:ADP-heptose:LPS heptosyltransferase
VKKLVLKCGLSPGDIVMLTAAVRDLHLCHPGQFITDVRTVCPELWEHNPFITRLSDDDLEVEEIDCSYPLINRCNRAPYHCLHGFIEFLNERLGLAIKPTAFKGDIHLSGQEKAWYSQVQEVTGEDTPFWVVAAGGKYDVTIKWWQTERYQQVVEHFRDKIQFVQVGQYGHHHPRLDGVIDMRGQTTLRELVRLVYHSQGVLCSVTALMHLAAAVPTRPGRPANRPCVVVAGGREPAYWEAYPGHQFIHTNGVLACCSQGGCWKDRTVRLRDGDPRDRPGNLCVDVVDGLPHCLGLISPAEVIRRIELYFQGGTLRYLSPRQNSAAQRGIIATARNTFDRQPLNLHNAGLACERFVQRIPPCPERFAGRGIVICGGGVKYFTCAWVCINMLRRFGCRLPIQLWHLDTKELDDRMRALVAPLGVECIDASKLRKKFPARILHGWELKAYAILHSPFREVLLLDADNVPIVDPEFLFDTPQFRQTGAIFWPDYGQLGGQKTYAIWRSCGLRPPREREFESGQITVDKQRCWAALSLSLWFNEHSDFYYSYIHGDKETFHLAFHKLKKSYSLVPTPIRALEGIMCQHDFQGRRIFQHRNLNKWNFLLRNRRVNDFWFDAECRDYIRQLQRVWDGGMGAQFKNARHVRSNAYGPGTHRANGSLPIRCRDRAKSVHLEAVVLLSAEGNYARGQTLANLAQTDWGDAPIHVHTEECQEENRERAQTGRAHRALELSLKRRADYVLLLHDDLEFNRHLRYNLEHWAAVRNGALTLASLYNPMVREAACDLNNHARIVAPNRVFGSQAFLIARPIIRHLVRDWSKVRGNLEFKLSRLAGRLRKPILYHVPSLVQRVRPQTSADGHFHQAMDFDPVWKA